MHRPGRYQFTTWQLGCLSVFIFSVASLLTSLQSQCTVETHFAVKVSLARSHCRAGYPGCVPKEIKYVYFLHVPKAGGSSVRAFLEKSSSFQDQEELKLRLCGLGNPAHLSAYFCFAQKSSRYDAARNSSCSAQQNYLDGAARERSFFEVAGCNLATGHYDFRVIDTLPRSVTDHLLIVVNLRAPLERVISTYFYLQKLEKGEETADSICPPGAGECMSLLNFTACGALGEVPRDRQVGMLAGDYCCYQKDQGLQDSARLALALANLDRVGAVVVTEHMSQSLQYLAHVLGFERRPTEVHENENPAGHGFAEAELEEVRALLSHGEALYAKGLDRYRKQNEVLARVAGFYD